MSDDRSSHNPLALQALLYAGGELADADAVAFEQRLATEQSVREALVQAVQLAQPLGGRSATPDPGYRRHVQRRLAPSFTPWRFLFGRQHYRGHPLLWTALGSLAASLILMFCLPRAQPEVIVVQAPPPEPNVTSSYLLPADDDDPLEIARVWAEIPKGDHLMRAHEEEMRKKNRAEDRPQSMSGDDRRQRPLSNTNTKH
jgi:hypothetical protein